VDTNPSGSGLPKPPRSVVTDRRGPIGPVVLGLAAAVLTVLASFTSPFTLGAEAITALPLSAGLAALVLRLRPAQRSCGTDRSQHDVAPPEPLHRWALVWLGLVVATVGWELYCYLNTPRSSHPTLSGLIDMLDARPIGKFVAFSLWLALGWVLVIQ
jgi:hypothetical protein